MNKSILVIDTPEDCRNCPLCGEDHMTYRDYCRITNDHIFTLEKPEWCPLKKLPDEVEVFTVDCIGGTFYTYKGYDGVYEYSKEDNVYWGKISNTNDLILFEGFNLSELYQSFKNAVDDYIELKKKIEKE